MKPVVATDLQVKQIKLNLINALKNPQGEHHLMVAIYVDAMDVYISNVKKIHELNIVKKSNYNNLNSALGKMRCFFTNTRKLTKNQLDVGINTVLKIKKLQTRIALFEKKILRLETERKQERKYLLDKNNLNLNLAGIEPAYAIRLLNKINFFAT